MDEQFLIKFEKYFFRKYRFKEHVGFCALSFEITTKREEFRLSTKGFGIQILLEAEGWTVRLFKDFYDLFDKLEMLSVKIIINR